MIPDADDLAIGLAIVEDRKHVRRAAARSVEKAPRAASSAEEGRPAGQVRARPQPPDRSNGSCAGPEASRTSSSVSIKVPERSTGCGIPGCRGDRLAAGSIKVPDRPAVGFG